MSLIDLVPAPYRIAATAAACALCGVAGIALAETYEHTASIRIGFIDVRGMGVRLADYAKDQAEAVKKAEAAVHVQETKAVAITAKAETGAVASQQAIQVQTRTLIQKVPYAVPVASDCPVPPAAVSLLNTDPGSGGAVPRPAPGADATGSGVALSDLVRHDIEGHGLYDVVADRLTKLQAWVRDQKALSDKAVQP